MPHPRDDARLVDSGVYALVRHPIYGGLILTAFGWALVLASPLTLLLAVVLAVFFGLKSRREEAWLTERYERYAEYMARTKRFVPYLSRQEESPVARSGGGCRPCHREKFASPVPPPFREGEGFLTT